MPEEGEAAGRLNWKTAKLGFVDGDGGQRVSHQRRESQGGADVAA